jgi:hypothetical protein
VLWFIFDLKYGCRRILQSHILERNLLSFLTGYPIVIAQVAFHQFLVPAATAAEWGKTVYEFQLHLLHKVVSHHIHNLNTLCCKNFNPHCTYTTAREQLSWFVDNVGDLDFYC